MEGVTRGGRVGSAGRKNPGLPTLPKSARNFYCSPQPSLPKREFCLRSQLHCPEASAGPQNYLHHLLPLFDMNIAENGGQYSVNVSVPLGCAQAVFNCSAIWRVFSIALSFCRCFKIFFIRFLFFFHSVTLPTFLLR